MSGSSGNGNDDSSWRPASTATPKKASGGGGAAGGVAPNDPCNIVEDTTLNSPNRNVLASLRAGDSLSVEFEAGPPQRLIARHGSGAIAGSITSPSMLQIIQCITQGGVSYVAEVLAVRGAVCQIRIRPQ